MSKQNGSVGGTRPITSKQHQQEDAPHQPHDSGKNAKAFSSPSLQVASRSAVPLVKQEVRYTTAKGVASNGSETISPRKHKKRSYSNKNQSLRQQETKDLQRQWGAGGRSKSAAVEAVLEQTQVGLR